MSRIDRKFADLKAQKRKALIPFIMAGDPDMPHTAKLLPVLAENGADLIEIGMPFSDPVADGSTIQQAGLRALKNNVSLKQIFTLVENFRQSDAHTPIILMGYYNPVYQYGIEEFCADAARSGVDGMILVDLPPEEEDEFVPFAHAQGLSLIKLVTPTTDEDRLKKILTSASGFIYYVSVSGITGDKSAHYETVKQAVSDVRLQTQLPIAVGFGIKSAQDVKTVTGFADAAVVGSALIQAMHDAPESLNIAENMMKTLAFAVSENSV